LNVQLGVSEDTLNAALAAIDEGAPVREVVECLKISGAERERAKVLFRNHRRKSSPEGSNCVAGLEKLSSIRTREIYKDAVDRMKRAMHDQQLLIDRFRVLEGEADAMYEELAVVLGRLNGLRRFSVNPRSQSRLIKTHDQLIARLQAKYAEMTTVLDQMHAGARSMTDISDAGLLRAGYKPAAVIELGGLKRDARTLYRRRTQQPIADPATIGFEVDPYFTDFLPILSRFEVLERAARETIRVRLANLAERSYTVGERMNSHVRE